MYIWPIGSIFSIAGGIWNHCVLDHCIIYLLPTTLAVLIHGKRGLGLFNGELNWDKKKKKVQKWLMRQYHVNKKKRNFFLDKSPSIWWPQTSWTNSYYFHTEWWLAILAGWELLELMWDVSYWMETRLEHADLFS